MRKIGLLVLIVLCIGTIRGFSQRCLPRQSGIEVFSGWGDGYPLLKKRNLNYTVGGSYFRYMPNFNKWSIGFEYFEQHLCYQCNTVPVIQLLIVGGYYKNILANKARNLFLNLGGNLLVGYESVNWGKRDFCDGAKLLNTDCFVGGGSLGIELEGYMTNRFLISCRAREKMLFNSNKTFNFQYTISLKFIIK
jgi:hypothetical protein